MNKENSFYRIINTITEVTGLTAVIVHYTAQGLIANGMMDYSFIGGNLGDYGATLAMTANDNRNRNPNDVKKQFQTAVLYASGWTIFEFLQKAQVWPGTYDTKDLLAFWAGSATAFLLGRLSASEKVKNLFNRNEPNSLKSLEERVYFDAQE